MTMPRMPLSTANGLTGDEVLGWVVAAHHDLVADHVAAAGEGDLVVEVELAGGGEHLAGVAVEEARFGAGPGEEQASTRWLRVVCQSARTMAWRSSGVSVMMTRPWSR